MKPQRRFWPSFFLGLHPVSNEDKDEDCDSDDEKEEEEEETKDDVDSEEEEEQRMQQQQQLLSPTGFVASFSDRAFIPPAWLREGSGLVQRRRHFRLNSLSGEVLRPRVEEIKLLKSLVDFPKGSSGSTPSVRSQQTGLGPCTRRD